MDLSVCFGTMNRLEMLKGCVESVRKGVGSLSYEIVITDGGSRDGTVEWIKKERDCFVAQNVPRNDIILVEHGEARGAVRAYYDAFCLARGEYVCYLSDDLVMPPGMLQRAVEYLKDNPQCGVVSLPYQNPKQGVVQLVYARVGNHRLPFACFGVLKREDGIKIDWVPRVTYHYYLDVGICLGIHGLGKTVEALPGELVIQHLMADNVTRGELIDIGYSSKRDGAAFNQYWSERL